jgi:hypothetical protein
MTISLAPMAEAMSLARTPAASADGDMSVAQAMVLNTVVLLIR